MNAVKMITRACLLFAFSLAVIVATPSVSTAAESTVDLGTARGMAVLAGSTITNTGPTVVSGTAGGDIGVSPGSAITGFTGAPNGTLSGTAHSNDAVAIQAQIDSVAAFIDAAGRTSNQDLTGQDLGGLTLTPGVYTFSSSAQLTGNLILDAQGDPSSVFIFQIGTTLTTASDSSVTFINGAQPCHVFWQVGSSATLGTNTDFAGHILALASITMNTDATIVGQLLAQTGAVTLDSNTITNNVCALRGSGIIEVTKTADPVNGAIVAPVRPLTTASTTTTAA